MPASDAVRTEIGTGLRFAMIGVLGTILHVMIVVAFVEWGGIDPRLANGFAFLGAFPLSYAGHYHISFRSGLAHGRTIWRFGMIALISFACGQFIMHLAHAGALPYETGLAGVVLMVPLASFVLNRCLVFHQPAGQAS